MKMHSNVLILSEFQLGFEGVLGEREGKKEMEGKGTKGASRISLSTSCVGSSLPSGRPVFFTLDAHTHTHTDTPGY